MTNEQVRDGFNEVYNNFWNRYKNRQPKENTPEWERMHTISSVLRKKYPLLEETVNRMLTELVERARGRGNKAGDYHRSPEGRTSDGKANMHPGYEAE